MTNTVASIVAAIFIIEGGDRAVVPYGILSVPVRDKAEARQVCENTVRNNIVRWTKAGKPSCYFDWLGDRYCPARYDWRGNRNWKRNIKWKLKHKICRCRKS